MNAWTTDELRQGLDQVDRVVRLLRVYPNTGSLLAKGAEAGMRREQGLRMMETLDEHEAKDQVTACLFLLQELLTSRLKDREAAPSGKR